MYEPSVEDLRNTSPCALKSPASLKLGWDSVIWLENKKEGKKDSTFELSVTALVRAEGKGNRENRVSSMNELKKKKKEEADQNIQ